MPGWSSSRRGYCRSNNHEMPCLGTWSRRQGNGAIEGHEPSSMLHGKSEQVDIGNLARPLKMAGVYSSAFKKADGAGPEFVEFRIGRSAQSLDGLER